jgi:hypothetical protein
LRPTAIGAPTAWRWLIQDLSPGTDILYRLLDHIDPLQLVQAFFEHANALLKALRFRRVISRDRIGNERKSKQG